MAVLSLSRPRRLMAMLFAPAMVIFLSSNLVNVGNLAFNMLFSRWMGPELFGDLALVLTIKLALLVAMAAVQMSVSQHIAAADITEADRTACALALLNRAVFIVMWLVLPVVSFVLWQGDIADKIGLGSPYLLLILASSLPFAAPLSILRGVAFGRENTARILASTNLEMLVRLAGSVVVWKAGFGIEGVAAAIAVSIMVGWVCLIGLLPSPNKRTGSFGGIGRSLAVSALPFGVLQLAQILALDGDIFVISASTLESQAGYVAALSLFQRIQFFACFILASVILPRVAKAHHDGGSVLREAQPAIVLYLAVACPFLLAAHLWPELLVSLLVGPEFAAAAAALAPAALASAAFTASYLVATFLAALNDRRGIWLTAATAVIQLVAMSFVANSQTADFETLIQIKAGFQSLLCLSLLGLSIYQVGQQSTGSLTYS